MEHRCPHTWILGSHLAISVSRRWKVVHWKTFGLTHVCRCDQLCSMFRTLLSDLSPVTHRRVHALFSPGWTFENSHIIAHLWPVPHECKPSWGSISMHISPQSLHLFLHSLCESVICWSSVLNTDLSERTSSASWLQFWRFSFTHASTWLILASSWALI